MAQVMEIVKEYPPNYEKIKEVLNPPPNAIFAYGEKIYNPSDATIGPDLQAHEQMHSLQMGTDPVAWWEKYLSDKVFRQAQEVEAYAIQYLWFKKRTTEKVYCHALDQFARHLSTIYKLDIDFHKAHGAIRRKAKEIAAL
ncbi:MAG: hypothetical protein V4469_04430 [Patescibacteria group bacterium]